MESSEAQKLSRRKWDKANMADISCRVPKAKKEEFRKACEKAGVSMHSVLLKAIDEFIRKER